MIAKQKKNPLFLTIAVCLMYRVRCELQWLWKRLLFYWTQVLPTWQLCNAHVFRIVRVVYATLLTRNCLNCNCNDIWADFFGFFPFFFLPFALKNFLFNIQSWFTYISDRFKFIFYKKMFTSYFYMETGDIHIETCQISICTNIWMNERKTLQMPWNQ